MFTVPRVAALAAHLGLVSSSELTLAPPLLAAFSGGGLLYLQACRIRGMAGRRRVRCVLTVSVVTGTATVLAPLPFAVLVFVLGAVLPRPSPPGAVQAGYPQP